jgi:hypothetical protein
VYAREVQGKELTFGVSGKLARNSLIMYDHQTNSLWSHLTGTAITGPMQGKKLEPLVATQTEWKTWLDRHPDTLILPKDRPEQTDPYRGYYRNDDAGILGRLYGDKRLAVKDRIVGVRLNDQAKAYALAAVMRDKVVNDTFQGSPLALVAGADQTAVVFLREVKGQALTFRDNGGGTIRDRETGTVWDSLSGTAKSGPLAGTELVRVPATYAFWFGWVDFFPGTELYK